MWFAENAVDRHFKLSVTGETVFFFRVWPLPSSRTGYIITSDEDIRRLKALLRKYYGFVNIVVVPGVTILGIVLVRLFASRWAPDNDYAWEILNATVMALVVGTIAALVFRTCKLGPIIRKYVTVHPMMEYVATEETATGWPRFGTLGLALLILALAIWALHLGKTLFGISMLAIAGLLFVQVVREHRARSRKRTADYASNPRL